MTEAALGGIVEVEGGQLAARKATQADVKAFAERMVKDDKGVELPHQLDSTHRADLDRLSKLSGAEFDRAYMRYMVDDHRHDVAKFRKAAKDLKDPEVKQFASSTLPKLEEHLRLAEKVAENVKAASAAR